MTVSLKPEFLKYTCWVFDCDGVLLDSNSVKTQAFYDVALPFGETAAQELVAYHVKFGGISRFVKFQYFFSSILCREPEDGELENLLKQFSNVTTQRLKDCQEPPRLRDLLTQAHKTADLFVVSGGMQDEVRAVLNHRGLDQYFTAIFGSPDNKAEILNRERSQGIFTDPAIFIGDAVYDYEVAKQFGLDFMFAKNWTDVKNWSKFITDNNINVIGAVDDLLIPNNTIDKQDLDR